MALVVKGAGQARPATAPRHRKTSAPPRPEPGAPPAQPPRGQQRPQHQPPGAPQRTAAAQAAARRRPAAPTVLPVPPDGSEKYSYVRRHSWVLTLFGAVCFPCLVFSQYQLMERHAVFWIYAPFVLLGVALFGLPLLTDGLSRGFSLAEHRRIVSRWRPQQYPSVDIFLPVCGEPVEVLRNTWKYVDQLMLTYQGQTTAYVLDDSASPELRKMAAEFGFAYAVRPDRGWLKKSGNLLFGYQISRGDFILLLDADFAPRHDLLYETLPYMAAFQRIGIVQTPQFFRVSDKQTWVERGAGAVQELFYRSIQTARARKGGATCVGSCAVYRRAALDDNGGMSLNEHSEDLLTGFDLYRLGWQLLYLPIALSTGTCPDNILSFLNQQYRWCSGTITLMTDQLFWQTKLRLYTRMCYISGFVYYIYTAVFTFIVPALCIMILIYIPNVMQLNNNLYILPIIIYAFIIYPMWHRSPYRLEAWSVQVISGWAHLFAFWDVARGKRRGWQPSGTSAKKQDGRRRFWLGVVGWSTCSAAAWVGLGLWRMMTMDPYNLVLIVILGMFELAVVGRILIQPGFGSAR